MFGVDRSCPRYSSPPPPVHGRRPARRRRALRALSTALIVVGALALLDAGVTLVWQEPFSALYAKFQQDHLRGALRDARTRRRPSATSANTSRSSRRSAGGSPSWRASWPATPRSAARWAASASPGSAPTSCWCTAPAPKNWRRGRGSTRRAPTPGTRFPGLGATTAIAGHRTTFLAPFRRIDELRRGDRILVDMPYAHFVYTVTGHRIVLPSDVAPRSATPATAAWCSPPAPPCSAPPNGCWCTRASPAPPPWARRWRPAVSNGGSAPPPLRPAPLPQLRA